MTQVTMTFDTNVRLRDVAHALHENVGAWLGPDAKDPDVLHDWKSRHVSVRVTLNGERTNAWNLQIRDEGPGLVVEAREDLEGLGLSIAHFLIDACFGMVRVHILFKPPAVKP